MKLDTKAFRPFLKEFTDALKDAGKKLGKGAAWYHDAIAKIEKDAEACVAAIEDPLTSPAKAEQLANALRVMVPDRKLFILAAGEAEAGSQAKAVAEVALDIGGRLIAAAVKHFLL